MYSSHGLVYAGSEFLYSFHGLVYEGIEFLYSSHVIGLCRKRVFCTALLDAGSGLLYRIDGHICAGSEFSYISHGSLYAGSEFLYSSHGFTLLQAVIESVTGQPFAKVKNNF